jgi:hypothetical protein
MSTLQRRGSVAQRGPGPYGGHQLGLVVPALESEQFTKGGPTDDPVDGQAGIALELAEGPAGVVAEDPVDPARVEPESTQALLKVSYIVTPQHGSATVQEAVADPETGLDQGFPGLKPANAIHAQTTQTLKGLDRSAGRRPEDAVSINGYAG